ncbi:MAG: glycosyltransferase [Gammaproteobacteria bacterium]|nr:glycosyltransferase [Gammaproteobacteria bacterium]
MNESSRKIRVMHVYKFLHDGGTERYIHTLISGMDPSVYSFSICCLNERGSRAAAFEQEGFPVYALNVKRTRAFTAVANNLVQIFRLARLLRSLQIDIMHTHDNYSAAYARLAALLARVPIVYVTYHCVYEWLKPVHHRINQLMAMKTTRIFAVSSTVKISSASKDRIPERKYSVIYNGALFEPSADPEHLAGSRSQWGIPPDARIIGNVGMLSQLKGQGLLIEAIGQLAKEFPDVYLVIIGSERDFEPQVKADLERIATDLGVLDRVVLAGSRDDVLSLLYGFELFVMPSRVEGFGLALVEAMCSGVPAIVSDIEAFKELTQNGRHALLCKSGSSDELTKALRYALSHREEMLERAAISKAYAREKFTTERMVLEYEKAYARDLTERGFRHASWSQYRS